MIGDNVLHYKLKSKLGCGGMATVYLAHDQKFDTNVAIKVLNKEFVHNDNIRKRFLAEAKSMFRMSHPNIIKVNDLIEENDTVAFVMEYIEGETLKEYLDRKGKLKEDEIKTIFSQMLEAVGYVHEQNLVHRDIKPSNFMIDKKGKIKLMDFGIAKTLDASSSEYTQTGTGMQMGTPMYMSPEQITETKSVTAQSDIYSLGVVLWQMVTGEKPYDTKTLSSFQLQTKIVNESLSSTSTVWDELIINATKKDMAGRILSCQQFIASILKLSSLKEDETILNSIEISDKTIVETYYKEQNLWLGSIIQGESLKHGFINGQGSWVVQPMFEDLGLFDDKDFCNAKLNGKYGFINRQGHWIIQPMFDEVYGFDNKELCAVELNGKFGFINRQGNWIVQPMFDRVGSFNDNELCRACLNGKYGFINRQGHWIIQPMFDYVGQFENKDICYAIINGKTGFINRQGNWIVQPIFDSVDSFNDNELCSASLNGKYGFINRQGDWIIQPVFDSVGQLENKDICYASINGKYGFINRQGNWIVQPMFDDVGFFINNELCSAKINGQYGFINRQGNWIIQPKFDSVQSNYKYSIVDVNEKYGLIDRLGNEIVSPQFVLLEFTNSPGVFKASRSNKYGYINEQGNWIVEPKFDYILSDTFGEEMIWDEDDEEWVYGSNSSNEIFDENTKVKSFFLPLTGRLKIYCEENIPSKKLNNFILNYNPEFFEEIEFLVYYDDTLFGKGDNGFLIVRHEGRLYIFLSVYLEFKQAYCLEPDAGNAFIQCAEYKGNKIVIDINSDELESYEASDTKTLVFKFSQDDVNASLFDFLNYFVERYTNYDALDI